MKFYSYEMMYSFIVATLLLMSDSAHACLQGCYCEATKVTCENIDITKEQLKNMELLPTVKEFYLRGNNLGEISASILINLKHLKVLEISKNQIEFIPINTFEKFTKLERLILNKNVISKLSTDMFNGLTNLFALELSENKISELSEGVFNKLTNIQDIRLNNNELSVIPNKVFTPLKNLRVLFFTRNLIHEIQNEAFTNMAMYRLGISYNQLKSIPAGAFKGFRITGRLVLLENPLDCSCEFAMNYALNFPQLVSKVWGYCTNPYSVRSENIMDAHKRMFCSLCDLKPCKNNGVCNGNKTSYSCVCDHQYKGDNCEIDICMDSKYIGIKQTLNQSITGNVNQGGQGETTKSTVINHTEYVYIKEKVKDKDSETKLIILYIMCAIEFIIILGFVVYVGLRKYREWKEEKEYNLKKTTHILFGVKNKTNAKLSKALYDTDYVLPGQMKELMLLDDTSNGTKMREIMMMDDGIAL